MTDIKKVAVPIIAVVVGGAGAALLTGMDHGSPGASPENRPMPALAAEDPSSATAQEEEQAVSGEVLERIDVDKYTYLRLGEKGSSGTWVAVPPTETKVGQRVSVQGAQKMTSFRSSTLNRTFDTIYFGTLGNGAVGVHGSGASSMGSNPHTGMMGHPGDSSGPSSPLPAHHLQPTDIESNVEIGKVTRAEGPLGRTVGQVHAERQKLAGKPVRVRGVVVKSVPNVLDRTFVHLRDGSGNAENNTHDLTVTTQDRPNVGDTVLYEGTLSVDRDYGSGYKYQAVLESARTVSE